jgi:tyrosinase
MSRANLFVVLFVLMAVLAASGQGIRKNYTEMTAAEKTAYVDALNAIYNSEEPGLDVVWAIAQDHGDYINFTEIIHTPQTEEENQFLPWHRMVLWEMEDAIKRQNEKLTIPYWDWRANRDTNDALFQSFLPVSALPNWYNEGPLQRTLGQYYVLPDSAEVESIQALSNFWDAPPDGYTNAVELLAMHVGPHVWIGGTMSDFTSPLDPIFYLHHGMVDKMWQIWEEAHGTSSFSLTMLHRYDDGGSDYPPNPYYDPLPWKNPNDIVDGRSSLGVFYSDGGMVKLNGGYEVTNDYWATENFVYPGRIEASEFAVPAGKKAVIHSNETIALKSGFVSRGQVALKVGGYDANFPMAKKAVREEIPKENTSVEKSEFGILSATKAPGGMEITFQIAERSGVFLEAYEANGRRLDVFSGTRVMDAGRHSTMISLRSNASIVYLRLHVGGKIHRKVAFLR